jgi:hypothetical protein
MSVIGVSPGSPEAVAPRSVQPVANYDAATGAAVAVASAAGQTETNAAIGSPDDAAWTGTGDGTVIAILKGIYANTAA